MSKIIFVIGKPRSGKTTYINSLCNKLKKEDIVVLNDWYILKKLAHIDKYKKLIEPYDSKGFKVLDNSIFKISEKILLEEIQNKISQKQMIIVIEFARINYCSTFKFLLPCISSDDDIIYIDTCFDECKARNIIRESHSVPNELMEKYYYDDLDELKKMFPNKVRCIVNS
ncbi:hypothetical protein [Aliarcobacter butzleri]|uniref:hypothetical protein n=1 Tax=Aliarcobacter butzleri TaxID=28197 RepID=UPI00344B0E4C